MNSKAFLSKILIGILLLQLLPLYSPVVYAGETGVSSFASELKQNQKEVFEKLEKEQKKPKASKQLRTTSSSKVQKKPYIEGEVIVKYKNSTSTSKLTQSLKIQNLKLEKSLASGKILLLKDNSGKKTKDIISQLKKDPNIEYIQPNYIYTSTALPNDTNFNQLWGLHNIGQSVNSDVGTIGKDTDWLEMLDIFPAVNSGDKIIVAVIDTGVNYNHPDLQGNMWNGANCVSQTGGILGGCIHGYDFNNNDPDPYPTSEEHGTHVSGTIAASMNNSEGVVGMAPSTEIMAIKGFESSAEAVNSINFARHNGAKIINASWGGYFLGSHDCSDMGATPDIDQALYGAIEQFGNSGGLFVAAAGNGDIFGVGYDHENPNTRLFPAGYATDFSCSGQSSIGLDNIISVAATDNDDLKAGFSDYGVNSVHVGAPGVNVYSTSEITTYGVDTEYIILDSFSSYSTGNTIPNWFTGTGNSGIEDVFYSNALFLDIVNPYSTGSNVVLRSSGSIDLSSVATGTLDFWVDCDIPLGEDGDYLTLELSSDGTIFNEVKRWDHQESSYAQGLWGTGTLGGRFTYDYWDTYNLDIDLSTYGTPNFAYQFRWVSDGDNDRGAGCAIDDFDFHTDTTTSSTTDRYVYLDGTSMASPQVAGLASLIWKYDNSLNYTQVKEVILNTGDDVASLSGTTITGKRINAKNAIESLRKVGNITFNIPNSLEAGQVGDVDMAIYDQYGVLYSTFSGTVNISDTSTGITFFNDLIPQTIVFDGSQDGVMYFTGGIVFSDEGSYTTTVSHLEGSFQDVKTFNIVPRSLPQPTGNFLSGATVNTITTDLEILSTEYPVDYMISGDILSSLTGTLASSGVLSVNLSVGDGLKTVTILLEDADGNTGSTISSITLDTIAPLASITSATATGTASQSIDFNFISGDADLDSSSIFWTNNTNGQTGTGNFYTVSGTTSDDLVVHAAYTDTAGNTGATNSYSYIIDNTPPVIANAVILNNGNIINISNQNSVQILGEVNISDIGENLHFQILDTIGGKIQGTLPLSGTGFTSGVLDVSSLADGSLIPSVYVVDTAGNTGVTLTGSSVIKETVVPSVTMEFLSGSITNTLQSNVEISSSEYPVDYTISGNVLSTQTGTLVSQGVVSVLLSSGDGNKTINIILTDTGLNQSNVAMDSIILDQTVPVFTLTSHTDQEKVQGVIHNLGGNVSDINAVESVTIDSDILTFSGGVWNKEVSLIGGLNVFQTMVKDTANNTLTGAINIIRVPFVSDVSDVATGTGSVKITFKTDLSSTPIIHYGTNQANLSTIFTGVVDTKNHTITLENLLEDTTYFYEIDTLSNGYTGIPTDIENFKTAKEVTIDSSCVSGQVFSGSVLVSGSGVTSSGFSSSCEEDITIVSESGHSIVLNLDHLELATNGWDQVILSPEVQSFSGTFTQTGYTHESSLTYGIGSDNSSLSFSGTAVEVNLFVGTSYNGQTFGVFRSSDNGQSYEHIVDCTISSGECHFQTSSFSSFTLGTPTDDIPDAFHFVDTSGTAPRVSITSNSITISGINTSSPISIIGGQYKINSGSLSSSTGSIMNGDAIEITGISSTTSLGSIDIIVTIGTVSDTFTITTKSIASSGGSGGGGGGSVTPTCVDTQLQCQLIPGTDSTYKFYRKENISCVSGNLGKTCENPVEEASLGEEKKQKVSSLKQQQKLQTSKGKAIFTYYSKKLQPLIRKWERLSYISQDFENVSQELDNIYGDFLSQVQKLDEAIKNKNGEETAHYVKAIANVQEDFGKKEKAAYELLGDVQILNLEGKKVYYIQYSHDILSKIQERLRGKISKKEESIEVFELENQLMYILHKIVNETSKKERKNFKKEGIKKYKELLHVYKSLSKKKKIIIKKDTSPLAIQKETVKFQKQTPQPKKTISKNKIGVPQYEVISHAVKLKADKDFKYLSAWLKYGDVVEVLENTHPDYIKVKIKESYLERYEGREGYLYLKHLRKIQ